MRIYEAAKARWRRDLIRWQTERIEVTSRLLGIPASEVTDMDIVACVIVHGRPGKPEPVMRADGRYGPRRRPDDGEGGTRADAALAGYGT